jgi:hypothetical protein
MQQGTFLISLSTHTAKVSASPSLSPSLNQKIINLLSILHRSNKPLRLCPSSCPGFT